LARTSVGLNGHDSSCDPGLPLASAHSETANVLLVMGLPQLPMMLVSEAEAEGVNVVAMINVPEPSESAE
jgi:hypothetical protein